MGEWFLLVYPVLLLAYLMLAARWQPKHAPSRSDDERRADDRRHHG
jgi:hypothetical protein